MTQIVNVSRLNPKTTEEDFQRFCTQFGNVIECIIYPGNDKWSKRSGYVKFATCQSAEEMYRQSRRETIYIDETSVNVELRCGNKQNSNLSRKKISHSQNIKKPIPLTIYTLNIQGQITDENELIDYLSGKPLSVKFIETNDNLGQTIKIGAQVTFNDKDLVDRILHQNHEKYTIKLVSNNFSIKREHDFVQPIDIKRSKVIQSSYLSLTSHLESITKLTHDIHEENECLKSEKSSLTITFNQQRTKMKQLETEKSDLVKSLSKTHEFAKCLIDKFKLRKDEHKTIHIESNRKISEFELIIKTANDALLTAKNEIQRLTNHVTTLETQVQDLTNKYAQSESIHLAQQHDIELFFSALENHSN